MKSSFKIVMGLIFISVIFFIEGNNVYAKKLEIDDVYKEFEVLVKYGEFSSSLNKEDKTIDVYYLDTLEKAGTFNYTSDYVEYDIRDLDNDEEYLASYLFNDVPITGMVKSILKLGGYDYDFILDNSTNYGYEDYGISLELGQYTYDSDDIHLDSSYVTYFKMSLDTDKFSTFADKLDDDNDNDNEEDEDRGTEEDIISTLKPIIEYENVTDNSVTIYPYVDYEFDDDREVFCYIYRSFERDGEYEKIDELAINCTKKMVGSALKNLDSDTTYYYKALIVGGTKFSDALEVTTLKRVEEVENPETSGAIYYLVGIIICSLAMMFYIKFSVKKYD